MARITEVRCIRTRANGTWVIVKVLTDQPGLYGIGSASDHYHATTVMHLIENAIGPRLIGRDASRIEDTWQSIFTSGYWRNGSLLNTALGAIDVALWDIKGKEAGMPIYQLLGGPCRPAVPCYAHAVGDDLPSLEDDVRRYMEEGYPVIRCQLGPYGGGGFVEPDRVSRPRNAWPQERIFDDEAYLENIPRMFAYLRERIGFGVKLTHDVHEHLRPQVAVALAKLLEPYRLFFLEDALPPEQIAYFRLIRQQCTTPQAMGELFVNPHEWLPVIQERLIDFIRCRVSKVGGITQAQKIAHLCEWYGVQTAWQEGGDNDPVNQAAAMHLDLASWNFGIQEENHFRPEELEVFPGHAVLEHGYLYPNDRPGLGVDIDEEKARQLLQPDLARRVFSMAEDRRADGTVVRP
ncbi:MAG TPA: enolase C-terminal domain-like protein [Chloroflexota bacterium]|jgi:mannonate dehydratase|nr:enolase C-terminal domain-like protein [Chloroflexota bacterium]